MNKTTHPYFVPNGDSRQDTAILLSGTAREFGVPQRDIAAVNGGFRISQALADVLGQEAEDEAQPEADDEAQPEQEPTPAPKKRTAKKTSGTRSAKNTEKE